MTDWDGRWKAGDTPWDRGAPAPPLLELLQSDHGDRLKKGRVLVPGCGSGHDVRALAKEGSEVVGLDLSPSAVAHARGLGPAQGTRYVSGSFFDYSAGPFDAIWEHTCFCAIDPSTRPLYAESCARLIRPGGVFAAVFYLEPWLADEIPEPPPYASDKEEIVELFSRNFDLIWEKVPTLSYPGREGREWLAVFGRIRRDREVAE